MPIRASGWRSIPRSSPGICCSRLLCQGRELTDCYSLDDLKSWVARNSAVSLQHIVVLTPQGRSVKLANLHTEVCGSHGLSLLHPWFGRLTLPPRRRYTSTISVSRSRPLAVRHRSSPRPRCLGASPSPTPRIRSTISKQSRHGRNCARSVAIGRRVSWRTATN